MFITKYLARHKTGGLTLLLGTALLFLSACNSNDTTPSANSTPTSQVVTSASAAIRHSPSGTVQLSWDHTTHVLTAQVALTGLEPKSVHPTKIYAGNCQHPGKVVYTLSDVTADTIGFANSITRIKDVVDGIPANAWYVNVHNGPGLSTETQALAITCANITNQNVSTKNSQAVQATLNDTPSPNQAVNGTAQLSVNNNQLTVNLSLKGLTPSSKHEARIYSGSCASQGKMVYPLKPIVANGSGDGFSTTVIPNVSSLPESGWYVNIHLTADISKQTGSDPIACGDITPSH